MRARLHAIFAIFTFGFLILGCSKDCETKLDKCNDRPESGACAAYFEGWFFDKEDNACKKIGFSGCSPRGFETEEACNQCKCN